MYYYSHQLKISRVRRPVETDFLKNKIHFFKSMRLHENNKKENRTEKLIKKSLKIKSAY